MQLPSQSPCPKAQFERFTVSLGARQVHTCSRNTRSSAQVDFRSDVNFAYFPNTYTKGTVCTQVLFEIIEDLSMFKKQRVFLEHVCTLCVFQAKCWLHLPLKAVKISRRFPYKVSFRAQPGLRQFAYFTNTCAQLDKHCFAKPILNLRAAATALQNLGFLKIIVFTYCQLLQNLKFRCAYLSSLGHIGQLYVPISREWEIWVTWTCVFLESGGSWQAGRAYLSGTEATPRSLFFPGQSEGSGFSLCE